MTRSPFRFATAFAGIVQLKNVCAEELPTIAAAGPVVRCKGSLSSGAGLFEHDPQGICFDETLASPLQVTLRTGGAAEKLLPGEKP